MTVTDTTGNTETASAEQSGPHDHPQPDPAPAGTAARVKAELADIGRHLADMVDDLHTRHRRRVLFGGRRAEDVPDIGDAHGPMLRAAQRMHRPAIRVTLLAAVVALLSGAATAWTLLTHRPWGVLDRVDPAWATAHPGLAEWVWDAAGWADAHTALVAGLGWILLHGLWIHTLVELAHAAAHGRRATLRRAALTVITTLGAGTTWICVRELVGTYWALLAVGVVLLSWQAMSRTTERQAHLVAALNDAWLRQNDGWLRQMDRPQPRQ